MRYSVTLEIVVEASDRDDALLKASALVNADEYLMYSAEPFEETQEGEGEAGVYRYADEQDREGQIIDEFPY